MVIEFFSDLAALLQFIRCIDYQIATLKFNANNTISERVTSFFRKF